MEKLVFLESSELTPIFDSEERKQIVSHLSKQFGSFLDNETFDINAGFKDEQVQLTLTLRKNDDTFFYPVEAIYMYDSEDEDDERDAPKMVALEMLEYLTLYFEDFLSEDRSVYLPLNWSVHQSDAMTFFMRGFTRNLKLEQEADEILSKHGHGEHLIQSISSEM